MNLRVHDVMPLLPMRLGSEDPERARDAWTQLHHLAQVAVEAGKSWGKPRDDDSHTALVHEAPGKPRLPRFVSKTAEEDVQVCLEMDDPSLNLDLSPEWPPEVVLLWADARTVGGLRERVRSLLEAAVGPERQPAKPAPDLPDHAVANGEAFTFQSDEGDAPSAEIGVLYSVTQSLLERFADAVRAHAVDGEHEVCPRLWPHHFDLASLLVVARDDDGSMTKTIGVGLTPPDETESSGYWYVSGWQKGGGESSSGLGELPLGRWVDRGGSPMAVLAVDEVWAIGDRDMIGDPGPVQSAAIAEFVAAAFNVCRRAIDS